MSYSIQVDCLVKNYGANRVLKGLTFQVEKGEIFALLGVNGAGKTTTLECMEKLRTYDGGSITINGRMGIQLQSASLPSHIKPMEAIRLFAMWNKVKPNKEMLEALGIDELGKKQYVQLSTGQNRRLHLALALTGDPEILFLDEPTAGLDVEGRVSLHDQDPPAEAGERPFCWPATIWQRWKPYVTASPFCRRGSWCLSAPLLN